MTCETESTEAESKDISYVKAVDAMQTATDLARSSIEDFLLRLAKQYPAKSSSIFAELESKFPSKYAAVDEQVAWAHTLLKVATASSAAGNSARALQLLCMRMLSIDVWVDEKLGLDSGKFYVDVHGIIRPRKKRQNSNNNS